MKNPYPVFPRPRILLAMLAASIGFVACKKGDDKTGTTTPPQLSIVSFSPAEASEGATVVIKGTAFAADKASNIIKINNLNAIVTDAKADGTELSFTVPEDAATGKITVTVGDKSVTSATELKINPLAPVITNIAPEKGDIGTEVTVTGNRFTSTSEVYFGGVKATEVTFVGKTTLKAKLPTGALNGKVRVKVSALEALSAASFWVKPTITGTPQGAEEDGVIEVNGTNFSTVATENTVFFGTVSASVLEATSTKLKVKVPAGAPYEFIRVVVKEQEAVGAVKFQLFPSLISFSPASAERSGMVTITGKNFSGAQVYLNGVKLWSAGDATTIQTQIPDNAVSGKLVIKQWDKDFQFATEIRVVNYWGQHDIVRSPVIYVQSSQFVYNNKIYFAFGYDNASTTTMIFMDKVRSYDPMTKTWKVEFDIPAKVPLRRVQFSAVIGNKWYFGGGESTAGGTDFWVKDLTQTGDASFTQLTSLTKGAILDNAFVMNGEIYLAGQSKEKQILRFDPVANGGKGSWNPVVPINMTTSIQDKILVIGNKAYLMDSYGNFYEFDPSVPSLQAKAVYTGRSLAGNSQFTLNGKYYCVGDNQLMVYDPAENKWTGGARVPTNDLKIFNINNRIFGMVYAGEVYEYIYQ